jgi:hypothetical protein
MPCNSPIPQSRQFFSDSQKILRAVNIFVPNSMQKGTIVFLFGGYKEEPVNIDKIVVGTKGWSTIMDRPLTCNECQTIKDLVDFGWKIIVLDSMQFVAPDNTVHNEIWIDEFVEWINETFQEDQRGSSKNFMVGFSSGAYIVGLHLRHLAERKQNKPGMAGYGIFSYPVDLDQRYKKTKKTDFEPRHFKGKPILFLSGSKAEDKKGKDPDVDGYLNTRKLYEIARKADGTHLGWESLDTGHRIFEAKDSEGTSCVARIVHEWFNSYPNFKLPLDCGTLKERDIENPDGHNVKR